jgi:DNA-binding beta-propeller fold protein YncE
MGPSIRQGGITVARKGFFLAVVLGLSLSCATGTASAQSGVVYVFTSYASYQFHTLYHPTGLAASQVASGEFFLDISDSSNQVVRQFNGSNLTVLAGTSGAAGYVDGATSSAEFDHPTGLYGGTYEWKSLVCTSSPSSGPSASSPSPLLPPPNCYYLPHLYTLLYVSDAKNYVVRKICSGDPPSGGACFAGIANTVTTVAGNHTAGLVNGASSSAEFATLGGISYLSSTGLFYIADAQNNVIRGWNQAQGTVTTYAGTGTAGLIDGSLASAEFYVPSKMVWDSSGNAYLTDTANNVIRKIDASGNVTVFAGSGTAGYADGQGVSAEFNMPCGIFFNPADGYLYVADSGNNMIRRVSLAASVTTYTGATTGGLVNGSLSQARFGCPMDVVVLNGYMYVSDAMNNVIRRIDMSLGQVSTYIS